jgi:hypothetical protein
VVVPIEAVPPHLGQTGLPPPERCLQVAQPQWLHIPFGRTPVEPYVLELEDHVELRPRRIGEEPRLLGP